MSAEAAGGALFDAIGRRNAQIFPGQLPHEAGEILLRHLARRGYRLVYDPVLAVEESTRYLQTVEEPVLVRDTRPQEPAVPSHLLHDSQTLYMGGEPIRCTCGCMVFDVLADWSYRCTSCGTRYTEGKR